MIYGYESPVACGLALLSMSMLLYRLPAIRGTTLLAPWLWAMGSLASLLSVEHLIDLQIIQGANWIDSLRFSAAMTTLCPAMAALGAKRPQDRAWQFVVLTLLVLLWLPPLQAWVLRDGEPLHVSLVWRWFLFVLLLLGATNYLPTRFWPSALLVLFGQMCLMPAGLPFLLPRVVAQPLVGIGLLTLSIGLLCARWPRAAPAPSTLDRVWLDFRNMYGAVWGLRVLERLESLGQAQGWPLTFRWHGVEFATEPAVIEPEKIEAVKKGLRSILWRFVSRDWIAERLDEPLE